jgi:hypothetical protein
MILIENVYICKMKYNVGDILICSKTWNGNSHFDVVIGDQYEVMNSTLFHGGSDDFSRIALDVKHIKSGRSYFWIDDRCFIPLSVYREFQLRKLLD